MASPITSIASSGLQASRLQAQVSAHNIANMQTEGYRRQVAQFEARADTAGVQATVARAETAGPSLVSDVVNQLAAKNAFLANLAVFRTGDQMLGSLLDARA